VRSPDWSGWLASSYLEIELFAVAKLAVGMARLTKNVEAGDPIGPS